MPTGRHLGHRAKARIARANRTAADRAPVIAELRSAGITSLKGIAAALDERHVLRQGEVVIGTSSLATDLLSGLTRLN
jgi:hypothetical protein